MTQRKARTARRAQRLQQREVEKSLAKLPPDEFKRSYRRALWVHYTRHFRIAYYWLRSRFRRATMAAM